MFELDNRLKTCADFVRKGTRVADIGTDHAYLPVWLCKNGITSTAIACDINPLPLESGIKTIEKYGVKNQVTAFLSNGLENVNPDSVDDIVIAGMGGELIRDIINNAKWLKDERYHLILQPMTKAEILREYLYNNGFEISTETVTVADNKIYSVMSVYYKGSFSTANNLKKYYGMINPLTSEDAKSYIIKVAKSLLIKGNGMLTKDDGDFEGKNYLQYSIALINFANTGIEPTITTADDIYNFIDNLAPFKTALDFDNVGFLIGNMSCVVTKVLVALDVNDEVIAEAEKKGAQLIISHHPVIFKPLKNIMSNTIPYKLVQKGFCVISAHTNFDIAENGVNTQLAKALELDDIHLVEGECMAVGNLKNEMSTKEFATYIKSKLGCNGLRYTSCNQKIKRVAVGGGACGEYIYLAKEFGADAFITGEIKHNYILESKQIGLTVVDVGHYKSEDVVIQPLVDMLSEKFANVSFEKSETFSDYISYI